MTDLLLPDCDPKVKKKEIHVSLPLAIVVEMDDLRKRHKDYLWGSTRSYYVEMALKWFAHFLGEEDANDQKTHQTGVQKAGPR